MGVLNVTPDSFSDGGTLYRFDRLDPDLLLARAEQMVADGAAILDIGGESTRPGAAPVTLDEERDRVLTAVELITNHLDVVISVDTSSPEIMAESASIGAGLLNDVRAFSRAGALEAAGSSGLPVSIMHMSAEPDTMQAKTDYSDVVAEVAAYLGGRIDACSQAGIDPSKIVIDPGFGFGKTVVQNYQLLARLSEFKTFGLPILVGLSRKSMIGAITGRPADQRVTPSAVLAVLAAERGATIIRVHDVAETKDALDVWAATLGGGDGS
ncbi:MAG: dihydropteroate synthase [Cellvibrionales bacterium TMED21]|jgi:dihydropteroate synthase|nr:dihydropteroate synthase [Halieaceae bacterium]OUT65959.1 MAG: dihydropteroate synthase [Cellvibrionales bacterium TMED21]|tara:strand:- start:1851 stop:2654 length:804 start_codon:yes stop_codon:yes gene_type:complete